MAIIFNMGDQWTVSCCEGVKKAFYDEIVELDVMESRKIRAYCRDWVDDYAVVQ